MIVCPLNVTWWQHHFTWWPNALPDHDKNITQIPIKEHSTKYWTFNSQNCKDLHNKESLRNCHNPQKPKETWGLNVTWQPGWVPGTDKDIGGNWGNLNNVRSLADMHESVLADWPGQMDHRTVTRVTGCGGHRNSLQHASNFSGTRKLFELYQFIWTLPSRSDLSTWGVLCIETHCAGAARQTLQRTDQARSSGVELRRARSSTHKFRRPLQAERMEVGTVT